MPQDSTWRKSARTESENLSALLGGLARMEKAGGRSRGAQGAGYFLGNVSGFSHAGRDDLVFTVKQDVDGLGEMTVERDVLYGFRFGGKDFSGAFEKGVHETIFLKIN